MAFFTVKNVMVDSYQELYERKEIRLKIEIRLSVNKREIRLIKNSLISAYLFVHEKKRFCIAMFSQNLLAPQKARRSLIG